MCQNQARTPNWPEIPKECLKWPEMLKTRQMVRNPVSKWVIRRWECSLCKRWQSQAPRQRRLQGNLDSQAKWCPSNLTLSGGVGKRKSSCWGNMEWSQPEQVLLFFSPLLTKDLTAWLESWLIFFTFRHFYPNKNSQHSVALFLGDEAFLIGSHRCCTDSSLGKGLTASQDKLRTENRSCPLTQQDWRACFLLILPQVRTCV